MKPLVESKIREKLKDRVSKTKLLDIFEIILSEISDVDLNPYAKIADLWDDSSLVGEFKLPEGRDTSLLTLTSSGATSWFGEFDTFVEDKSELQSIIVDCATPGDFRIGFFKISSSKQYTIIGERIFTAATVGEKIILPADILNFDDLFPTGEIVHLAIRDNAVAKVIKVGTAGRPEGGYTFTTAAQASGTITSMSTWQFGISILINRKKTIEAFVNKAVRDIPVDKPKLILPAKIETYVGDTLQVFKYSICSAYNPNLYNIQFISDKTVGQKKVGDDYRRYWQYIPTEAGTFNVSVNLYNNSGVLIDSKKIKISVSAHNASPATIKNVMFLGDSLTFYNRISDEFVRLLTTTGGATTVADTLSTNTVNKPAGKGLTNIQLVGTQKQNHLGWVGQTFHEGRSGWEWKNYIQAGSPFWIGGAININTWLTNNSLAVPDIIYIGLGWNDIFLSMPNEANASASIANAKTLLRAIKTQLPTTKVYLWTEPLPSLLGGEGAHPYGSDLRVDTHLWKRKLSVLYGEYNNLVADPEFSTFVSLIASHAMVDSENAMQQGFSPKNARITETEMRGKDDIHPADSGFFQISDSIVRSFIHNFCS
jgi:hypothetical protein